MTLSLENRNKIKNVDHWDMLKEIADELKSLSARVSVIRDTAGIGEIVANRKILANELANVEVMKEIVRLKLSVMDGEWKRVTNESQNIICERLSSTDTVPSLEDFI